MSGLEWDDARPMWEAASKSFAERASGKVHVFIDESNYRSASIWGRIEFPTLIRLGSPLRTIRYHLL
jgi:hypothetical protein